MKERIVAVFACSLFPLSRVSSAGYLASPAAFPPSPSGFPTIPMPLSRSLESVIVCGGEGWACGRRLSLFGWRVS